MSSPALRFRLKGQVGEAERSFLLADDDVKVGSASGNDIVLPFSGVSRQHALIRPRGDAIEVADLESKNGLWVNGARVASAVLSPGDEVGFGPVRLRLEAIDGRDVELAVVLESRPAGARGSDTTDRATGTWDGPAGVDWISVLERVVPLLLRGRPALGDALALLVEEARLQGGCLAELRDGSPVMLAAAGTLSEMDLAPIIAAVEAGTKIAPIASGLLPGTPGHTWAAVAGDPPHLALFWGSPPSGGLEPVLRLLVQITKAVGDAHPESGRAVAPRRTLDFPLHYVRGTSRPMRELYARMESLADTTLPVLISGETGAGKEDVARALHLSSSRARGPFVAVNCAAIPAELLEAELFGVGKGAATGVAPRAGRFQSAHAGTLFLDEIGDLALALQAKLLRALETGEVEPVAGPAVRVDLRIVSATNVDIASRLEAGQFRPDLYYRLCADVLRIPPLRERRGDIPALIDGILRPLAVASGKPVRGVTAKALDALVDHSWPGNVRELAHEIHRLFHVCAAGEAIEFGMLRDDIKAGTTAREGPAAADVLLLQAHVDDVERRLISQALARAAGNRTEAAKLLGISRNGLALKTARLGLDG